MALQKPEPVKQEEPKPQAQTQEKNGTIDHGDEPWVHPDVQKVNDGGSVTYEVGGTEAPED